MPRAKWGRTCPKTPTRQSFVLLATDGLSEPGIGVADPPTTVQAAVSHVALEAPEDRRAVDTCRSVVETAMHAHRRQKAGDNMACSVLWLER